MICDWLLNICFAMMNHMGAAQYNYVAESGCMHNPYHCTLACVTSFLWCIVYLSCAVQRYSSFNRAAEAGNGSTRSAILHDYQISHIFRT